MGFSGVWGLGKLWGVGFSGFPQNQNKDCLFGPNSIMVVYMDPLGQLFLGSVRAAWWVIYSLEICYGILRSRVEDVGFTASVLGFTHSRKDLPF